MEKIKAPEGLDAWVRRLGEEEFPMFAHTARSIASISSSDDRPTSELAQIILRDNTMTARVLKMANSVYYNPTGVRISTVSRAIVILGFNAVRSIALSIGLVETMLSGSRHDNALAELVRSFHAAVQVKEIADEMKAGNTEELFIAALLYRIGAVSFWCFPYGKDDALEWQYHNCSDREEAERRVLGFTLRNLTVALTRDWQLSTLLATVLTTDLSKDRNLAQVDNAYRLADAVVKGWNHPDVTGVIRDMSQLLGKKPEWVTKMVYQGAQKAARVMEDFGIANTGHWIPAPPGLDMPEEEPEPQKQDVNLQLQLSILRELSSLLAERADVNLVLSTVLEGIYRGLKMDHVVLAMVDSRQQKLIARFVLGAEREQWSQRFQIPIGNGQEHIFTHVLGLNEPLWIDKRARVQLGALLGPDIQAIIGTAEFFVAPLRVQGQVRGVIYADRIPGTKLLGEQDYLSFRHFCEHANIAFHMMAGEGRRG